VSDSCTSARDGGCVCAHDPAKQLLLMHVSRASYSHVCALCESSREKQRECVATEFVTPADVDRPTSLLSCSKCVPSCVIINNSQDTDVCRRGVRRRNFFIYCLCYYDLWRMQDENQGGAKTMEMLICMKI
jgi:hypothetical protein